MVWGRTGNLLTDVKCSKSPKKVSAASSNPINKVSWKNLCWKGVALPLSLCGIVGICGFLNFCAWISPRWSAWRFRYLGKISQNISKYLTYSGCYIKCPQADGWLPALLQFFTIPLSLPCTVLCSNVMFANLHYSQSWWRGFITSPNRDTTFHTLARNIAWHLNFELQKQKLGIVSYIRRTLQKFY